MSNEQIHVLGLTVGSFLFGLSLMGAAASFADGREAIGWILAVCAVANAVTACLNFVMLLAPRSSSSDRGT